MNRYYWILVTLVTRPMIRFLAFIGLLVSVGLFAVRSDKTETPTFDMMRGANVIVTKGQLLDLAEHPSATPVQISIERIASGSWYYEQIDNLPIPDNVEAIFAGEWVRSCCRDWEN